MFASLEFSIVNLENFVKLWNRSAHKKEEIQAMFVIYI